MVLACPRLDLGAGLALLKGVDADIYHSQQLSLRTYLAQRACPDRLHLVTCRDPRILHDWWYEFRHPTYSAVQVLRTAAYYENPLSRVSVQHADAVYVPAVCLAEKVMRKYKLAHLPHLLPTPIRIPLLVQKAERPTVCYVGRLDRRKHPELFFNLASSFPEVRFIAAGFAQDPNFAAELSRIAPPNLQQRGFIDQFASDELSAILGTSWVLINPAGREGLPNTYLEACAHRCAILSEVNPEGFASRFGRRVANGDFAAGLRWLLTDERWRAAGEAGYAHVRETNEFGYAVAAHLNEYYALLSSRL